MRSTRTISLGVGLTVALALTGCGSKVATTGAGAPPVLHIGSGTMNGTALDAAAPAAARGNGSSAGGASTVDPYPLQGTLPTGPSSAPAYRYGDTPLAQDKVAALAAALGITAAPVRHAHGWKVSTSVGTLLVRDGAGMWSYGKGSSDCPPLYALVDIDQPDGVGISSSSAVGCVAIPPTVAVAPAPASTSAADCPTTATACADVVTTPVTPVPVPSGPDAGSGTAPGGSTTSSGSGTGPVGTSGAGATSATDAPTPVPVPGTIAAGGPSTGGGSTSGGGTPDGTAPGGTAVGGTKLPDISDAAALDAATPLLTALGYPATDAVVQGTPTPSREVTVDPTVDGLPTVGITTHVEIDGTGAFAAFGVLGTPAAAATYPLMTAATALDRLRAMPRPEIAIACVQGSVCPGVGPQTVTGATLGFELFDDAGAAVLVPSWFFTLKGQPTPMTLVAVRDQFLADPSANPSDPGATGAGSTGAPIPVTSASSAPGASDSPGSPGTGDVPPSAVANPPVRDGSAGLAVTAVGLGKDGSTLLLTTWGGVCESYTGHAVETGTTITVSVSVDPAASPGKACPAIAKEVTVPVTLASPWNKRTVVDAASRQTLPMG